VGQHDEQIVCKRSAHALCSADFGRPADAVNPVGSGWPDH
jgi:hypothetical protein